MPGQGSSLNTVVVTFMLHRGNLSHFSLTTASEFVDIQSVVFIRSSGHTFLSSVLPKIAFSIKMFPLGQVKFMVWPSHVVSLPLKKYDEITYFTKFKENIIKCNENG